MKRAGVMARIIEAVGAHHINLLFLNWLNYYVYQLRPYDIKKTG